MYKSTPTIAKHQSIGYQNALADLMRCYNAGGEARVMTWIKDNMQASTIDALKAQPFHEGEEA